ncbi:hypothetical protein [Brevundimonas sp.]|uniref:hypothetical protein n=1 Tax=Brevundimonas sp. TaxID=1871086 RepID=UPI003D106025
MSAFEFFFSFYGLLLGLSVAELVGGLSRVLHERQRVRFGWLTPLLALFVAMDVATFWSQAWTIFRGAPFNLALLFVGLVVAATFYIAASVTFPRVTAEGVEERIDLDDHFWAHRRLIFSCILAANLIVVTIFISLMLADASFATLSSPRLWIGFVVFSLGAAAAAFAPRRFASCALILLVTYSLFNVARSAGVLLGDGGWSLPAPGA